MTIDHLPGEVLLEIFDHYLGNFQSKTSLRVWSNNNGWFKLAHVCHKWRSIVLASPYRLRVLLFFAESSPTRAAVLECPSLAHLRIVVDYSRIVWNASALTRLNSALRYPNRVVRITINGSCKIFDKVCKALDQPLPALRSLELHNMKGDVEPIHQASSLLTSIKSLLNLRLDNVELLSLLPLLSITRALVSLILVVDTLFWQREGTSVLTHLQRIPRLRDIRVSTRSSLLENMNKPPITTVLLAELSHLYFSGQCAEIEWFVAGLTAPSLQRLHISVTESSHTLCIPHLSKFISVSGINFFAARLSFSRLGLTTSLFARDPHSMKRIVTFRTPTEAQLASALSPMLATLEDVFLCITSLPGFLTRFLLWDVILWRKLFEEFRNVKVLRIHRGLEADVADVLRQCTVNSSSAQGDMFPSLKEIWVYPRVPVPREEIVNAFAALGEYVTARKEVGRPVEMFCGMDGQVPTYHKLPDVGP